MDKFQILKIVFIVIVAFQKQNFVISSEDEATTPTTAVDIIDSDGSETAKNTTTLSSKIKNAFGLIRDSVSSGLQTSLKGSKTVVDAVLPIAKSSVLGTYNTLKNVVVGTLDNSSSTESPSVLKATDFRQHIDTPDLDNENDGNFFDYPLLQSNDDTKLNESTNDLDIYDDNVLNDDDQLINGKRICRSRPCNKRRHKNRRRYNRKKIILQKGKICCAPGKLIIRKCRYIRKEDVKRKLCRCVCKAKRVRIVKYTPGFEIHDYYDDGFGAMNDEHIPNDNNHINKGFNNNYDYVGEGEGGGGEAHIAPELTKNPKLGNFMDYMEY